MAKRNYKREYEQFQGKQSQIDYRNDLNKANRKRGDYGNGDGLDLSHEGSRLVKRPKSQNRSKNGKGSTMKKKKTT